MYGKWTDCTMQVSFLLSVIFTVSNKHTSLLHNLYIFVHYKSVVFYSTCSVSVYRFANYFEHCIDSTENTPVLLGNG